MFQEKTGGGEWESNPPGAFRRHNGFEDREGHQAPFTSTDERHLASVAKLLSKGKDRADGVTAWPATFPQSFVWGGIGGTRWRTASISSGMFCVATRKMISCAYVNMSQSRAASCSSGSIKHLVGLKNVMAAKRVHNGGFPYPSAA